MWYKQNERLNIKQKEELKFHIVLPVPNPTTLLIEKGEQLVNKK